jgi:hypothetical protein
MALLSLGKITVRAVLTERLILLYSKKQNKLPTAHMSKIYSQNNFSSAVGS